MVTKWELKKHKKYNTKAIISWTEIYILILSSHIYIYLYAYVLSILTNKHDKSINENIAVDPLKQYEKKGFRIDRKS